MYIYIYTYMIYTYMYIVYNIICAYYHVPAETPYCRPATLN